MYRYETHLHTSPISACARATMEEALRFFKDLGHDGVFVTEHFLDGNTKIDRTLPWEEQMNQYFSSYELGLELSEKIGIKVFSGVETGRSGSHFLVYGLDKKWFIEHPEIMQMKQSENLKFMADNGGFIVHAHPFREDHFIDHIRLFPRHVHAVEIVNANRNELENSMAKIYSESYGLFQVAGSDNHAAGAQKRFAGVQSETPINSVEEFIQGVKNGTVTPFTMENILLNKE